jgi:chemotaxis signal transduction protein
VRLAISHDAIEAVGTPGAIVAVPGAEPWLRGLTVWGGRLRTLIDAGLLFGGEAAGAAGLVVLKGLAIDTALAVDALPRTAPDAGPPPIELDLASLSAHPALQPGAASRGAA